MKNILKRTLIIAKLSISIGLIWFILNKFDFEDSLNRISLIPYQWIALVIFLLAAQLMIASIRFREILIIMNHKISLMDAFATTYIGYFFSQTALSFVGGDAVRIMHVSKQKNISSATTAKAVILDRISGFFGQIILLSLTLPFLLPKLSNPTVKLSITLIVFAGVIIFALTPILAKVPKSKNNLPLIGLILDFADRIHKRMSSWHALYSFFALSAFIALINCLIYYVICLGMNINVHLLDIIILMPPVFFLSMLPISLSGWGVRESSTIFALGLAGIQSQNALAVSVCFGLILLLISLPGVLFWLRASRH